MLLENFLEDDKSVNKKHFVSEKVKESVWRRLKVEPFFPSMWHENKSGNISVLPYSCALRAGASYNYLLVNGVRRPTPRENLRLQGFPENYPIVVPDFQIRKQAGNSVPVSMIEAVARKMVKTMNSEELQLNGCRVKIEQNGQVAFTL